MPPLLTRRSPQLARLRPHKSAYLPLLGVERTLASNPQTLRRSALESSKLWLGPTLRVGKAPKHNSFHA
jgi:hypothetical protein